MSEAGRPPAATRSRVRVLARVAGLAVSLVAIAVLIASIDVDETVAQFANVQPILLIASGSLVFVQLVTVTARWSFLLPGMPEGGRVAWTSLVRPVAIGYLGNFILPARLGELLRAGFASRVWQLGMARTLGSVVLERVIDTSVLGMIALLLAALLDAPTWVIQVSALVAIAGAVAIAVLAAGFALPLARWVARRNGTAFVASVGRSATRFLVGATADGRRMAVLPAAVLTAVSWLVEGVVYWVAAAAIGLDVHPTTALLVAAVTVLSTAVPSAPAYVGTFELAVTASAAALGVPSAMALAWAIVAHVVTVLPLLVAGIGALMTVDASLDEMVRDARRSGGSGAAAPPEGASSP